MKEHGSRSGRRHGRRMSGWPSVVGASRILGRREPHGSSNLSGPGPGTAARQSKAIDAELTARDPPAHRAVLGELLTLGRRLARADLGAGAPIGPFGRLRRTEETDDRLLAQSAALQGSGRPCSPPPMREHVLRIFHSLPPRTSCSWPTLRASTDRQTMRPRLRRRSSLLRRRLSSHTTPSRHLHTCSEPARRPMRSLTPRPNQSCLIRPTCCHCGKSPSSLWAWWVSLYCASLQRAAPATDVLGSPHATTMIDPFPTDSLVGCPLRELDGADYGYVLLRIACHPICFKYSLWNIALTRPTWDLARSIDRPANDRRRVRRQPAVGLGRHGLPVSSPSGPSPLSV
jgi:hypothetical protein